MSAVVEGTPAHNVFTGASSVSSHVSRFITTLYDAWKHFTTEVIVRFIVKYTTEEAHRRGETKFLLSQSEFEAFITLQYARGLMEKIIQYRVSTLWNMEFLPFQKLCHGIDI